MKEVKTPKKPFIYYLIIAATIMILLNTLVFPNVLKHQVKEVGYNEFLAMVDNNQVTQVEKDDTNGEYMFICLLYTSPSPRDS